MWSDRPSTTVSTSFCIFVKMCIITKTERLRVSSGKGRVRTVEPKSTRSENAPWSEKKATRGMFGDACIIVLRGGGKWAILRLQRVRTLHGVGLQPEAINPICGMKQDVFRSSRCLFFCKFVRFYGVLKHLKVQAGHAQHSSQ